jgi:hypothetical protein
MAAFRAQQRRWALDLRMALTNHNTGNMGSGRGEPDFLYAKDPGHDVHQKDAFKFFTRFTNDAMTAPLQMAFAGVWDRFPKLQFYWAETMIGWLEYGLWQIDDHYRRYIGMIHDNWGLNVPSFQNLVDPGEDLGSHAFPGPKRV